MQAAGCAVLDGRLRKGVLVVVRRKKNKVHEGMLTSLRRIRENVDEVRPAPLRCCATKVVCECEWT